jgi:TonB family protein
LSDDRKDDDELRREEFADYQAFGEHRYPQRLKLSRDGSVLIDAHVVSLEAASFDESLFASPPGAMARRQCKDMVHPVAIRQPEPAYPRSAAQNHIGGTVIVSLTVQTDGSVSNVQYLERAGHEMDQVTKEIVETWKFKPARCGSEAVVSDIRVEMAFHP